MKIDLLGYRTWARLLASSVMLKRGQHDIEWHTELDTCRKDAEILFLIGWSDIIPPSVYRKRIVIVLHPSPLPLYRGGSPIQHQILAGEKDSALSFFVLDQKWPGIDAGPLVADLETDISYSLSGELQDILFRISNRGAKAVIEIIDKYEKKELTFVEQDDGPPPMPRRKPEESEITLEEISKSTASYLYNKIRCLQDPYPNAFIQCGDGKRLYITQAHIDAE